MKHLFAALLAALTVVLAASCNLVPLPQRMDKFVDNVEKNYTNYTQDDWDAANEKFEALCNEYQQTKGSLTQDEIKQVRSAMGRYAGIALRAGAESITGTIQEIGDELPGLLQGVKDFIQELGGSQNAPAEEAK